MLYRCPPHRCLAKQECAENRLSAFLCGACADGFIEIDNCIRCTEIDQGCVSLVYVMVLHDLAQRASAETKVRICFAQTALMLVGPAQRDSADGMSRSSSAQFPTVHRLRRVCRYSSSFSCGTADEQDAARVRGARGIPVRVLSSAAVRVGGLLRRRSSSST